MKQNLFLVGLRLSIGFMMLWAFVDKLFGLGFATTPEKSWLAGGSPTTGFLKFGTHGWFKPYFDSMIGSPVVDWLFMLGLLGVGIGLILGIAMKLSTFFGSVIFLLMWLSLFPPKNNPVVDDHLIYIFSLGVLYYFNAGEVFGLGKWWNETSFVKRFSILR